MVDSMSVRAASRKFGISRKTVSKMVKPGYQRKDRPVAPKLGAFVGIIHQILQGDRGALEKQRHTAKDMGRDQTAPLHVGLRVSRVLQPGNG